MKKHFAVEFPTSGGACPGARNGHGLSPLNMIAIGGVIILMIHLLTACMIDMGEDTCADPVIDPIPGTYTTIVTVSMSCATEGAAIYYTIDGTVPTVYSTRYAAPLCLSASAVLSAIAAKEGSFNSAVVTAAYTINLPSCEAPTFDPPAGSYLSGVSVTLACTTPNAIIRYTTDGTAPSLASQVYSTPIGLSTSATIRAFATLEGCLDSSFSSAVYTIGLPQCDPPTFDPPAGAYRDGRRITISCAVPSAVIHYKIDGSDPDQGSAVYTGPVPVEADESIRAVAVAPGRSVSSIAGAGYDIVGWMVETLAGTYNSSGMTNDTGNLARFDRPMAVASDGTNLFVADTYNHSIRRIVISTGVVTTLAGSTAGTSGNGYLDETGTNARFQFPMGILYVDGNLFVSDTGNDCIRQIVPSTGVVTTYAGSGTNPGSADGDRLLEARFYSPKGLATDGTHLFVADYSNYAIRQIDMGTGVTTTLVGNALNRYNGVGDCDGTGTGARIYWATGLACDGTYLYFTHDQRDTIRRVTISTALVETIAGVDDSAASTDGLGASARFNLPTGIACFGGYLYVTEYAGHTVRRIDPATMNVTTVAGSGGTTGSVDALGALARFDAPASIATDGTDLFVVEDSRVVRRLY